MRVEPGSSAKASMLITTELLQPQIYQPLFVEESLHLWYLLFSRHGTVKFVCLYLVAGEIRCPPERDDLVKIWKKISKIGSRSIIMLLPSPIKGTYAIHTLSHTWKSPCLGLLKEKVQFIVPWTYHTSEQNKNGQKRHRVKWGKAWHEVTSLASVFQHRGFWWHLSLTWILCLLIYTPEAHCWNL